MIIFPTVPTNMNPGPNPKINWGSRFARGIQGLWLFDDGGTFNAFSGPTDLVTRLIGFPHDNNFAMVSSAIGQGMQVTATSAYWFLTGDGNNPRQIVPTDHCTIAMIRRKTDTTLRASSAFSMNQFGNTRQFDALVPYSDGTIYWDFGGQASPNRLTWSGYSVSTAIEYWTFVAGATGSAIYFNGVQKASQSTAISRVNGFLDNLYLCSPSVVTADLVEYYFLGLWRDEWNATEVMEWYQQPFRMLMPQARRLWADVPLSSFVPYQPEYFLAPAMGY